MESAYVETHYILSCYKRNEKNRVVRYGRTKRIEVRESTAAICIFSEARHDAKEYVIRLPGREALAENRFGI